jgi:hypothetical protein
MPPKRTREISLTVLHDFQIPPFYEMADPESVSEAIKAGSYTYQSMKHLRIDQEVAYLKEAHSKEVSVLTKKYETQLQELKDEQEELLKKSLAIQNETIIEPLRKANDEKRLELDTSIAALDERRRTLDSVHQTELAFVENTIQQKSKETMERLTAENLKLHQQLAVHAEQLTALNEFIRHTTPSQKKLRSTFINIFRHELIRAFNSAETYSIVDIDFGLSKGFLMMDGMQQILWDVYTEETPLTSEHIETFISNVQGNGEFPIGVMVSAYSPITDKNRTGNRYVEFNNGKMLVFLSEFETMDSDRLHSLMLLFQLWWQSGRDVEKNKVFIRSLEEICATNARNRLTWITMRAHLEDASRWMTQTLEESEKRMLAAVEEAKQMVRPQ